jgi:hypothetical protein
MSCCTPSKIYDLGLFDICGFQTLPIELPLAGNYIITLTNGNFYFEKPYIADFDGEKPIIDFSKLPVNMEFNLYISNSDGTLLSFDLDIQPDPCTTDAIITECFSIFKLKSMYGKLPIL